MFSTALNQNLKIIVSRTIRKGTRETQRTEKEIRTKDLRLPNKH